MRKFISICLLAIIIFVLLTLSTANLETQNDGNDRFGFPTAFYIRFGGMTTPAPTTEMTRFVYLNLLVDITVAFIIAIIISILYPKIKKRFTKRKFGRA